MDITTATPVEIDTKLFELYLAEGQLQQRLTAAQERVFIAVDASRVRTSTGRRVWDMTFEAAEAKARKLAATDTIEAYVSRAAKDALAKIDEVRAGLADNRAEQAPLHAEFDRRGGWTRAFLVQNTGGHVHRSMGCGTCFPTTQFAWMVAYSGKSEGEIVTDAGERACTVCYQSAPVDVLKRPTKMFGPDEIAAQAAREQRAAEKTARDAAKAAKAIRAADGSTLVDHMGWAIKTERTAWTEVVDIILNHRAYGYDEHAAARDAIIAALAAKLGQTEAEIRTQAEAKVQAKAKREHVTA